MNKQNNLNLGFATRTFVGMSMMALAMVSITACGSNGTKGGTTGGGTVTGDTNGTSTPGNTNDTILPPATTGGNVTEPNTVLNPNAGVTGNSNGTTVSLAYAVLSINSNATDANKAYGVTLLNYNPYCFYQTNPDSTYSTYPNSFDAMALYLTNGGVAPTAGAYSVGGTQGIAASSGFETVVNCAAKGALVSTGSTVTITAIDTTAKTASGSVTMTLSDGSTFTGSFTTVSSCAAGTPATASTGAVCTDSSITYN